MHQIWIPLLDIPAEGADYEVDEQAVWQVPLDEFSLPYRIVEPLKGKVFLLPQEDGCLVRGRITGTVAMPCTRCAEDALVVLDQRFESYEAFPGAGDEEGDDSVDEAVIRPAAEGPGVELGLSGLLWEEFLLALPVKPLCSTSCKGLCPSCGKDLNEGACSCSQEEGDPRMSALRGLKIDKH